MITAGDIRWLAGLMEGEGSFGFRHPNREKAKGYAAAPHIQLKMTDKDVVERAASIMGTSHLGPYNNGPGRKEYYVLQVGASKAAQWMMTLYALMGERRKGRIEDILGYWRAHHIGRGHNKHNGPRQIGLV